MNEAAVMAEVAQVLGELPGIRMSRGHPVESLSASPAVVVGYGRAQYGIESDAGATRLTLPVWVAMAGGIAGKDVAGQVGAYGSWGDGDPRSVIDKLHARTAAGAWETCDYVRAVSGDKDIVTVADKDHLALTFELDVVISN